MVKWRAAFVVVLAVAWSWQVSAQTGPGSDPQEVAEVLTELDAAGTPATAAEITGFLGESPVRRTRGYFLGRTGQIGEEGGDHTARLRLSRRWLEIRGRWRHYRDGSVQSAGAVVLGPDRWQVAVGQLGFSHGFGLLVGGPGRGPALTADGSLGGRGRGLVPWAGTAVPQTVLGAGIACHWGRWQTRILAGRRGPAPVTDARTTLGQVAVTGEEWRAEALVLSDPMEFGASLAGGFQRGALQGSWEGAWRRPHGAGTALSALLAQGGWRPHRALRLEILAGWADLGPRPVMGQKHPVFGDWGGQGVAVRGTWRVATGLGLKLLVHRGRGRQEVATGRRELRTLADVLLTRNWPGGWSGEARWREGGTEIVAWSERFPWRPPAAAGWDNRRVLSLKAGWQGDRGRGQILWRRLTLARVRQDIGWENGGSRSLVALTTGLACTPGCYLRAAWTLSWGEPVDLVSAVVPFTGYVLPRHWGRWRAEHLLGMELRRGSWRGRMAVSWRQADLRTDPEGEGGVLSAWLEGAWIW